MEQISIIQVAQTFIDSFMKSDNLWFLNGDFWHLRPTDYKQILYNLGDYFIKYITNKRQVYVCLLVGFVVLQIKLSIMSAQKDEK